MNRFRRAGELLSGLVRLGGGLGALAAARRPRPRRPVHLPGLEQAVRVEHDRWGVPHVYGGTVPDVIAVQGFLHGTDRLWQMELQRRLGAGRLAEILGPSATEGDRLARTLGMARAAAQDEAALPSETASLLHDYVRGVNTAIRSQPTPLEFRLLGCRPEPWTVLDVLVWTATMALILSENWAAEALRARLAGLLGPAPAEPAPASRLRGTEWPDPPPAVDLGGIRPRSDRGSNAWAVDGRHTDSGAALLACDPHLGVSVPGVWYENHLDAPGLRVTGASLPGAPGVVIGHNERIAWGVTNARVDVQDLYRERLDPQGLLVRTVDGWTELTVRTEQIEVRGGSSCTERVRESGHGPLVTDFLGAVPACAGEEFALRWAGPAPAGTLEALLALNRAPDWDGFRAAVEAWTSPAQNFVYADVTGRVGYLLGGTVPVRASRATHGLPVPGWTGEYEWIGELAQPRRPCLLDPAEGRVVSANTAIVDPTGEELVGEWVAGYRHARIDELLRTSDRHDVDSFATIQADLLSLPGLRLASFARWLPADDPAEHAARDLLAAWDGWLGAGDAAGVIYRRLRTEFVRVVHADTSAAAEALALTPGAGALRWQPGREFLDSVALPPLLDLLAAELAGTAGNDREPRLAPVLERAWHAAISGLCKDFGPSPVGWAGRRSHQFTLAHPFGSVRPLRRLLNRGPFPVGGDADTVCAANVTVDSSGEAAFSAATYRMVCDTGDWDRSRSVLPTGQSGRPGARHYLDQTPLWLRGEHHPMPWTETAVRAASIGCTAFEPAH